MDKDDEIIKKAIVRNERLKLKKLLAEEDELAEPKKPWWPYATAAAVLCIAAFSYWMLNETETQADLYAAYYQKYPNVVSPLTRSEESATEKEKLYQDYEKGDYALAISGLEALDSDTASFYLALTYLETQDYQKAESMLDSQAFSGSAFELYVKWYRALALLKMEQENEAILLLNELKTKDFPLAENVQLLLKDLKAK
ncbi:hypothetical protein [uncultured Arcticibacterium sp.]|uniref:tetratricopeptide repeat protein n=1 Tax=uncultured Arcticibacterium sp. TaxID=2173042 RepID=UPI0030FA06B0